MKKTSLIQNMSNEGVLKRACEKLTIFETNKEEKGELVSILNVQGLCSKRSG